MSEPLEAKIRKLDTSGRFTMPDEFLELYPRKLILAPGFDNCIRGYAPKQWDEFDKVLQELDANVPDEGDFLRFIRAMTVAVTLDANNRFRFSETLMNWVGVDEEKREVQMFDAGGYLEFWEVGRWNQFMTEKSGTFKELARRIFGKANQAAEGKADGAGS